MGSTKFYQDSNKVKYHYNKEYQLHREDGPALEFPGGTKEWCYEGKRHREGGPAIEFSDGTKAWFYHGERHRLDGPAIEYSNGNTEWWYHGKWIDCYSQEEFERLLRMKAFW